MVELFAGVGGFRLGLEGTPSSNTKSDFEVIWSNQWEPSQKVQWASDVYVARFGTSGHSNEDIHDVRKEVPNHDLLVGGFPCQDYSTARTRSGELGIQGEKGKLWTPIKQIIRDAPQRPKVVLRARHSLSLASRAFGALTTITPNFGFNIDINR